MKNKNVKMNETFFQLSDEDKMKVLEINDDIFSTPRFRNINKNIVLSDLWRGKTNSQKRNLLKKLS